VLEPERDYSWKWLPVNFSKNIIVLSNEMKVELLKRLPLLKRKNWNNKIISIYSIVDFKRFKSVENNLDLKNKLGFKQNYKHILYVAAFSEKKNQISFIESALPELRGKDFQVHFIGDYDSNYGKICLKKIMQLGCENSVQVHGFIENVVQYYQAADVCIIPTKREGLARCMIESLACGTPVISFDVSSAKEILLQNQWGMVIPQGDYSALAEAINNWENEAEFYKKNIMASSEKLKKLFSASEIVKKYEQIYFG